LIEFKDHYPTKEEIEKYQCPIWQRLIYDSMKDFDNRTIRKEILSHVFHCEHQTCKEVARIMKGVMN